MQRDEYGDEYEDEEPILPILTGRHRHNLLQLIANGARATAHGQRWRTMREGHDYVDNETLRHYGISWQMLKARHAVIHPVTRKPFVAPSALDAAIEKARELYERNPTAIEIVAQLKSKFHPSVWWARILQSHAEARAEKYIGGMSFDSYEDIDLPGENGEETVYEVDAQYAKPVNPDACAEYKQPGGSIVFLIPAEYDFYDSAEYAPNVEPRPGELLPNDVYDAAMIAIDPRAVLARMHEALVPAFGKHTYASETLYLCYIVDKFCRRYPDLDAIHLQFSADAFKKIGSVAFYTAANQKTMLHTTIEFAATWFVNTYALRETAAAIALQRIRLAFIHVLGGYVKSLEQLKKPMERAKRNMERPHFVLSTANMPDVLERPAGNANDRYFMRGLAFYMSRIQRNEEMQLSRSGIEHFKAFNAHWTHLYTAWIAADDRSEKNWEREYRKSMRSFKTSQIKPSEQLIKNDIDDIRTILEIQKSTANKGYFKKTFLERYNARNAKADQEGVVDEEGGDDADDGAGAGDDADGDVEGVPVLADYNPPAAPEQAGADRPPRPDRPAVVAAIHNDLVNRGANPIVQPIGPLGAVPDPAERFGPYDAPRILDGVMQAAREADPPLNQDNDPQAPAVVVEVDEGQRPGQPEQPPPGPPEQPIREPRSPRPPGPIREPRPVVPVPGMPNAVVDAPYRPRIDEPMPGEQVQIAQGNDDDDAPVPDPRRFPGRGAGLPLLDGEPPVEPRHRRHGAHMPPGAYNEENLFRRNVQPPARDHQDGQQQVVGREQEGQDPPGDGAQGFDEEDPVGVFVEEGHGDVNVVNADREDYVPDAVYMSMRENMRKMFDGILALRSMRLILRAMEASQQQLRRNVRANIAKLRGKQDLVDVAFGVYDRAIGRMTRILDSFERLWKRYDKFSIPRGAELRPADWQMYHYSYAWQAFEAERPPLNKMVCVFVPKGDFVRQFRMNLNARNKANEHELFQVFASQKLLTTVLLFYRVFEKFREDVKTYWPNDPIKWNFQKQAQDLTLKNTQLYMDCEERLTPEASQQFASMNWECPYPVTVPSRPDEDYASIALKVRTEHIDDPTLNSLEVWTDWKKEERNVVEDAPNEYFSIGPGVNGHQQLLARFAKLPLRKKRHVFTTEDMFEHGIDEYMLQFQGDRIDKRPYIALPGPSVWVGTEPLLPFQRQPL